MNEIPFWSCHLQVQLPSALTSLTVEEAETTLCAAVLVLGLITVVFVESCHVFGHQMHHQYGFQEAQQHQTKVANAVDG